MWAKIDPVERTISLSREKEDDSVWLTRPDLLVFEEAGWTKLVELEEED